MDLLFEYRGIEFEWEGFGLESFRMYPSLSLYIYLHKYMLIILIY